MFLIIFVFDTYFHWENLQKKANFLVEKVTYESGNTDKYTLDIR